MESMTWVSHPAHERPLTAVLVTIFIALVMILVYFMIKSALMVLVAGFIFLISLSSFYFPTTFTVDEKKVSIKYLFSVKERNLSAFRQYYPETRGILLSPYLSPSRLENFRGFYLRYDKNNKAEVDAFVKKLIDRKKESAGLADRGEVSDAV